MKTIYILLLFGISTSAHSNGSDWKRLEEHKTQERQKMEAPISGTIGGVQSGDLEKSENQEEKMRRKAKKQKFLYEYNGYYRKGL